MDIYVGNLAYEVRDDDLSHICLYRSLQNVDSEVKLKKYPDISRPERWHGENQDSAKTSRAVEASWNSFIRGADSPRGNNRLSP